MQYIAKYGKTYASKEEYPQRFETFKQNYQMVKSHNLKKDVSFQMSLNQYSDMTSEEHLTGLIMPANINEIGIRPNREINYTQPIVQVPRKLDWRAENVTSTVVNQGRCKSDWAIVATSTLEAAVALLNNVEHVNPFSI